MCRQNHLWGCVMIAFGIGMFVGTWLEADFLCKCFAVGLTVLGFGFLKK